MSIKLNQSIYPAEVCEEMLNYYGYFIKENSITASPEQTGKFGIYRHWDSVNPEESWFMESDDRDGLIFNAVIFLENVVGPIQYWRSEKLATQTFGITKKSIGSVIHTYGRDEYVLLTRFDGEDFDPIFAELWLLPRVYSESANPEYFCHSVSAMRKPHAMNSCVCIIHLQMEQ